MDLRCFKIFLLISISFAAQIWGQMPISLHFYDAKHFKIVKGHAVIPKDSCMLYYSDGATRTFIKHTGRFQIYVSCQQDRAGDEDVRMVMETPSSVDTFMVSWEKWQYCKVERYIEEDGYWQFSYINNVDKRRLYLRHLILLQDTTYVPPPTTFFKVTWDANKEEDLAGYKVHFGIRRDDYEHTVDVGNKTFFLVERKHFNLLLNTIYYFAVTAYDTAGNESKFSKQVTGIREK
jgi:hypothetical protein